MAPQMVLQLRWSNMGAKIKATLQDGPSWPQDGPKRPPRGPKMAQDGPKMAPRGPKMGSGWAQKSLNSLRKINIFAVEGHLGPKMAPSWPQEAPRWPRMGSRGPLLGPDWDRGEKKESTMRVHMRISWGLTGIGGRKRRAKCACTCA